MKHYFFILVALLCMASCNSGNDIQSSDTEGGTSGEPMTRQDSVIRMCTYGHLGTLHQGNVFNVVIMADGYTQVEINRGSYASALNKAKDALFAREPMKSLTGYVNILTVTAPSNVSGIEARKKDTVFRTYFDNGSTTNVYGDSVTIQCCAQMALIKEYDITTDEELRKRLGNTLVITLLNSSDYKGVTLLGYDEKATDGIPGGWSLSYVPTYARIEGVDVFEDLIQHEGVGHGIAKLGDEYFYEDRRVTSNDEQRFKDLYKHYFAQNLKYDATALTSVTKQPIESDHWLYQFTQDATYNDEDIRWYAGAFEFPTHFWRSSEYSVMNATTDKVERPEVYDPYFNVAGRAMIYKRIMRCYYGSSWKFDNAHYSEFTNFDQKAREERAKYKATQGAAAAKSLSAPYYIRSQQGTDRPQQATPKVIEPIKVRVIK